MITWLNSTAMHVFGVDVSWAEVLGDLTGAVSVWWAARENVWNWPIGLLNSALFFVLFLDAKLYADATLQIAFIGLGVFGWVQWARRDSLSMTHRPVGRTSGIEWIGLLLLGVAAQAGWTAWLATHTDSPVPFWDASILVLSLMATYAQARKYIESWWIWIAVDLISVPLYVSRGLYPTAVLYAAFGVMCIVGLRTWMLTLREQRRAQVATLLPAT